MTAIPKLLTHIWIGPRPAPLDWMKTWCDFHPDWEYQLIDNAYVAKTKFKNQIQINEYLRRSEFAGAADLIRYEVLRERGGLMPEADSICVRNTDELLGFKHQVQRLI